MEQLNPAIIHLSIHFFIGMICLLLLFSGSFILLWWQYKLVCGDERLIEEERNKLESLGLKFNYSYKATNKKTGIVRYLRIYDFKVVNGKVNIFSYSTTPEGEIGSFYNDSADNFKTINEEYDIEEIKKWHV